MNKELPMPRLAAIAVTLAVALPVSATDVKILLPLERGAYQTNEWIDISVVRSDKAALAAGTLSLTLRPRDFTGGEVTASFDIPAVALQGKEARRVEHLHVNGWLLRPGKYKVEAAVGNDVGSAEIEVFSHVRQSSFRLVNWGRAQKEQQQIEGEDSLGFNTYYGDEAKDNLLRAGVDAMGVCVMSGGHQMDLRLECDWSDPYVTRGGTRRVVRRALADRTRPNVIGVHFYDEPGLTWAKHPVTGDFVPHDIPAQVRSYRAAFDKDPPAYYKLDAKNTLEAARWKHWITWKQSVMDAAWKESQFGVSQVRPDLLSLTQSQYGWSAFTDGYYFNVARSLPITSGHGGYHDFGPGFFNPSMFLEMARARDQWKPCWYLPTWYGNTTSDQFRMEQYLSFQTGIQGMLSPPDLEPAINPSARAGIVASNQLMKRLGPIFTTMQPTKAPVAMLYSLSAAIQDQFNSKAKRNYLHEMRQGQNLMYTYLAGKLIQQPFDAVLDEDVFDGSVASDRKAVVVTSVDYLDPKVARGLEDFVAAGGLVLLTADCTVQLKGAKKLAVTPVHPDQALIDKLNAELKTDKDKAVIEQKQKLLSATQRTGRYLAGAMPLAKAIKAELAAVKLAPVVECDVPTIVATRHRSGDVEYIFLVNATPDNEAADAKGNPERVTPKAAEANIVFRGDGRPIYDALVGGNVAEINLLAKEAKLGGKFRFGPGQMRVFARTSRPIGVAGGVKLARPVVTRDLVREKAPIVVKLAASVVDDKGDILSGSIPLHVLVIDPLGVVRHQLYRATENGQFAIDLPLAANDAAGDWSVVAVNLLAAHPGLGVAGDIRTFEYQPPAQARAIAGGTPRAISFRDDAAKVFRFARTFHEATIVKGKSPFYDAAANRLTKILAPWGVKCKELDLTEASKPRSLSEEEARTWVGLAYTGSGQIKPGDKNAPILAGFNVRGPVIVLGTPQDNPLIEFLLKEKFLPYAPDSANLPGPGRGYFAWQRDAIGPGQESIALIAYDEAGMAEAVGSVYEAAAGLEPLTRFALPGYGRTDAIRTAKEPHVARVVGTVKLPDRIDLIKAHDKGVIAASHDGNLVTIAEEQKPFGPVIVAKGKPVSAAEYAKFVKDATVPLDAKQQELVKKQLRPDRMQSIVAAGGNLLAVAYWGGTLRVVDHSGQVRAEQRLQQDITAMTWLGDRLVVGLADGRIFVLELSK
jgi:hypothetical protein